MFTHIPYHIYLIFLVLFSYCSTIFNGIKTSAPQFVNIIPQPNQIQLKNGVFILNNETGLKGGVFPVAERFLKNFIENGSDIDLAGEEGEKLITFNKDESLAEEAYKLKVDKEKITIEAATDMGAFYAVQTLRQLLPIGLENRSFQENQISIQAVEIQDEPAFPYRGAHLDVGRHFFPVEFVKQYIDYLAMLKLNKFHWHLTEDQGWRIEIKKYPKLTEIGAFRDETVIGRNSGKYDGKPYGGFYTQEEVKDVVAYAKSRNVTVIPEIEMPGHSTAAIAAYPWLGCTGEQIEVAKTWGVFEDIYCPKEETFEFLENVLDEVMDLFPSEYIHIGGDEAPKAQWEKCAHCQALIKQENLKDEHGLQSYFITRMEKYLNDHGRQIIGWDEILEGGLAPNATVMSWRGMEGAIEAAKQGNKAVLTPTSHFYFDYSQSLNPNEPFSFGSFIPLSKVYSFNPIPEELTKEQQKYIIGAQANLWTEYIPTTDQVEYMIFPRILALSEVVWSEEEDQNYDDFVKRVQVMFHRLDALDVNYANHLYEIEGKLKNVDGKPFYEMESKADGVEIHYTTDGSQPSAQSQLYSEAVDLSGVDVLKAGAFQNGNMLGNVFQQNFTNHKAMLAKVEWNKAPNEKYGKGGAAALTNGLQGSEQRFTDDEWLGWQTGEPLELTIDFKETITISNFKTRFFDQWGSWVYAPKSVELNINGETTKFDVSTPDNNLAEFSLDFEPVTTEQVAIKIHPLTKIPAGNVGEGSPPWLFVDELIFE